MYTDLYKIKSIENPLPKITRVEVELNEKHKIFEGHFPGEPIMPGVCLIDMIKEISGQLLEQKLFLKRAKNIKFVAKIDPFVNKYLFLDFSIKKCENEETKVECTTFFGENTFFKFSGLFEESVLPHS